MHASEYTDKSDTDSGDGGVGRKAVIAASHTTRENDEDSVYTGYSNPIRVSRRLCSPTSITNVENSFLFLLLLSLSSSFSRDRSPRHPLLRPLLLIPFDLREEEIARSKNRAITQGRPNTKPLLRPRPTRERCS